MLKLAQTAFLLLVFSLAFLKESIAVGGLLATPVYQGLTGSYEDARHIWLLVGLVLASMRLQVPAGAPLARPRGST